MTEQIFISYSKKDSALAYKLADDLETVGFKVWIDRSIGGGDLWRETIEKNLKAAGEVIIMVSPNSMASEWVKHEGSLAYGWSKKLYPVLIEKVEALPPWLEEYQWVDFVKLPYTAAFDLLVTALTPPNPIQDLLDQQVQVCRQTGDLIGEAILRVVNENRSVLVINNQAEELIARSQQVIDERIKREQQLIAEREEARRSESQKAEQIRQLELDIARRKADEAEQARQLEARRAEDAEKRRLAEELKTKKAELDAQRSSRRLKLFQRLFAVTVLAILVVIPITIFLPKSRNVMTGQFRIAVAEFTIMDQSGQTIPNKNYEQIDDLLASSISKASSASNSDIAIQVWGPEQVGGIETVTVTDGEVNAAKVAEKIHAHVVVYGNIIETERGLELDPKIYYDVPIIPEIEEIVNKTNALPITILSDDSYAADLDPIAERFITKVIGIAVGSSYYSVARYEDSLEFFLLAEENNSPEENENVYVLLGNTYVHLAEINNSDDNLKTAMNYFEKAIAINPNNVWARIGMADIDYRLASGDIGATTFNNMNWDYLDNASTSYQFALNTTLSTSPAFQFQNADYKTIRVYYGLGQIYLARGLSTANNALDISQAKTIFTQIANIDVSQSPHIKELACHASARLAIIAEFENEPTKAIENFEKAVQLCYVGFYSAYYRALQGDYYLRLGRPGDAIEAYSDALKRDGESAYSVIYKQKLDSLNRSP